ncbi:hypothetical protein CIK74_17225 [Glutamicibacter sp. BW77]|nr:hypothetical protein CIK74_17225 [Glutamicibacter sp. BW77]
MVIKTGARVATPKPETPPAVVSKTFTEPKPAKVESQPEPVNTIPERALSSEPVIFEKIEQGTDEWFEQRRGIVTASVVGLLITTKTMKPASNETSRGLTRSLAAERITGFVEPSFTSRDMERGNLDEPIAREHYSEHYAEAREVGFITREIDGYKIGYSPDGLVGAKGLIEVKSRAQKKQLETFLEDCVPPENMAQIQCGLLVSGREWCDYLSWTGGMPMYVKRVYPIPAWQEAIKLALRAFEENAEEMISEYYERITGLPATERIDHFADMEVW